jgi:hypothetical protein
LPVKGQRPPAPPEFLDLVCESDGEIFQRTLDHQSLVLLAGRQCQVFREASPVKQEFDGEGHPHRTRSDQQRDDDQQKRQAAGKFTLKKHRRFPRLSPIGRANRRSNIGSN